MKNTDDWDEETRQKYASENVFPIETSGPFKGKYKPKRDERGNVIVDPTSMVKENAFALDFIQFKRMWDEREAGKNV